ncbi:MAG: carboxypeptidase-like regulatory domain-containing protein [Bryobacteraceae bacterium]
MRLRILAACLSAAVFAPTISAQTTFANITGAVADSAGAAVPGAEVEATHVASNYVYKAQSNATGTYTIAQLREGVYTLRVRSAGFQEYVAQNIVLASREQRRIDVQLQVGTVETKIEVSAGATLIETETARIGDSKSATQLKSLPLNTRSLYNFLALTPGVLAAGGQATRRFAGSRVNQSEQSIDGITVSNGYDGTQISPLVSYIESYEEVRVDMANNSADIGSVGQVTVISKSGSNDVHGVAFDYYSTPWFRARNPFAAQRGTGITHQPGVSLSGPVVLPKIYDGKNKTFFFFSFETSRGSSILQLLNPTVPLEPWRQGDFSSLASNINVRDPFASNQPFPGRQIPASRINPVSDRIQDRFYPLPQASGETVLRARNYNEQKLRPYDPNTYYTIRGDHRFSEKSFLFARWTWNRSHSRAFEGNLPTIGQRWQTRDTRAISGSYTYAFTPTVIFESRYGFAFNDNPRNGPIVGSEVVGDLGLVGLVDNIPDINGLPDIGFQGLALTGIAQTPWRHPGFKNFQHQWQEHVNWFKGKHSIKAGAIIGRVNFQDSNAPAALFGQFRFSNRFTGFPYSDFLLGIPTTAARAFPQLLINRTRWSYDFFVTDDFKMRQNLTVNIGMRYELHPSWSEANNRQSVFDINRGVIVVPDGGLSEVSPLMPRGYVDIVEASSVGLPGRRLLKMDRNNFAPRIGLAWRPLGPNTVFRAGYGLFYDVVPRAESAGGAPFQINEPTFTNPANNPTVIFPQAFPSTGSAGPRTVGLPAGIRADLRNAFSMQYNATIEHQQWDTGFRLSYIGTNTRQGEWGYNYNQPVANGQAFIDKPRPFPNYPAITYISNGAGHQYHSMMFEAERRFARGLAWQFSYVLARDIGDLDRGAQPEDAYNRLRERAVWHDMPTHRVTGNLIAQLPFGRGKRYFSSVGKAANLLVGGWETSLITSYYSGQRVTPLWTGPDPVGIAFTSSRTAPNVTIRADHLHNANLPSDQRSVDRWFDTTAFGPVAAGRFGTSAKNVIIGPDSKVWHVGLYKYFDISERFQLRWELTGSNAFNHPNYSNPASNLSQAASFGVISGVGGASELDMSGSRTFRTGVRAEW